MRIQIILSALFFIFGMALAEAKSSAQNENSYQDVAKMSAYEAVRLDLINTMRLPKNSKEEKELDTLCLKGPREYYSWIQPGQAAPDVPTTWATFTWMPSDPLLYCREQIAAYRTAKVDYRRDETDGQKESDKLESSHRKAQLVQGSQRNVAVPENNTPPDSEIPTSQKPDREESSDSSRKVKAVGKGIGKILGF